MWRPAFPHLRACPASITGYARRFWQGSTDHRGVPGHPGRVVTLLPELHANVAEGERLAPERCWGTAYEIASHDPDAVLKALDHRERGGYERVQLEIDLHPRSSLGDGFRGDPSPDPVTGLVYIAGPQNGNFLGAASVEAIALQIQSATGPSGPNPEYVFELAKGLRAMGAEDTHVFAVEAALRQPAT